MINLSRLQNEIDESNLVSQNFGSGEIKLKIIEEINSIKKNDNWHKVKNELIKKIQKMEL